MSQHAQEVQSSLDRRYNEGIAAEAALAQMNRSVGFDEAAELRAMYQRVEVAARGEHEEQALARAVMAPLHPVEEELARQNEQLLHYQLTLLRERLASRQLQTQYALSGGVQGPTGAGTLGTSHAGQAAISSGLAVAGGGQTSACGSARGGAAPRQRPVGL